jgi:hypothetical protein
MWGLDAGTDRHERRGLGGIVANLTLSLHTRNGPYMERTYALGMRWIATIIGLLTVVVLALPLHP